MNRIVRFQGLRGLAAISILMSHYFGIFNYAGAFGVSVFIYLSGFLIVYTYKESTEYNLKWFIRKIVRFYPLYLLITIITSQYFSASIVYGVDRRTNIRILLANLLMVQTYSNNILYYGAFSQVGWYIPFLVLSIILTPFFIRIWKRIDAQLALFCLLIVLCFEFSILLLSGWGVGTDIMRWLIYICPVFRLLDFFGGGCIAVITLKYEERVVSTKKRSLTSIVLIVNLLSIMLLIKLSMQMDGLLFYNAIWLVPVWILVFLIGINRNTMTKIMFENPLIVFVGNISLELFLCHLCIKHYCEIYLQPTLPLLMYYIAVILITFILSFLVYRINLRVTDFFNSILYKKTEENYNN